MTSSNRKSYMSKEEFIGYAVEIERKSAAFYRAMLGLELDKSSAELVQMLEKEERRHEEILKNFTVHPGKEILQIGPEIELSLPPFPRGEQNVSTILDLAIEREKITKTVYEKAAEQTTGAFRELLSGLAVFEKQHEEKLISLKSYY